VSSIKRLPPCPSRENGEWSTVSGGDAAGAHFRELQDPDGAGFAHELVDADGRKVDRRRRR
jgi:hypothetical protein